MGEGSGGDEVLTPDEVRLIRERAGLSRLELASDLGVSYETIRAWESPFGDPHNRSVPRWHVRRLRQIERAAFGQGEQG